MSSVSKRGVTELEKEKYDLLEKIKELECSKTVIQSDDKRKDDKLVEFASKLNLANTKIASMKEKSKTEHKNICTLIKKFASVLKKVQANSQASVEYMTKIFHGLAIQKEFDVTDIPVFDAKQAIVDLCGSESS